VQQSSPDGSGGLYAGLGGDAIASGDNTLTSADLSATMVDQGGLTALDGTVTTVAASESSGDTPAIADASTFVLVGGSELAISFTQNTAGTSQNHDGSAAYGTSTTTVIAYDLPNQEQAYQSLIQTPQAPTSEGGTTPYTSGGEHEFDGNVALVNFDAAAIGEDSLLLIDAFAISLEDELSISSIYVELVVG